MPRNKSLVAYIQKKNGTAKLSDTSLELALDEIGELLRGKADLPLHRIRQGERENSRLMSLFKKEGRE